MEYNPLDPDITRNPYPVYAYLRREAPIYRTPLGFLAVSRYRDVLAILRYPARFSSSATPAKFVSITACELGQVESPCG